MKKDEKKKKKNNSTKICMTVYEGEKIKW